VPNEISSDHNVIKLDLDTSTDRRQAKEKKDYRTTCEKQTGTSYAEVDMIETIESLEKSTRNLEEVMTEFTSWITKVCDKTIPRTYTNGWPEITWSISQK